MARPRSLQEFVHWLELGAGARWIRLAAVLLGVGLLSLLVGWKQFRGVTTEATLLQADVGRQLAAGAGFSTLVNYPQVVAFLGERGVQFDARTAYPELYHAPLYSLLIAGGLRLMPASVREGLFTAPPTPPDGFGGDYFLLGLNLLLLWLAAWLTFDLARRLFDARTGWLAMLGMLVSVGVWQQAVLVNGAPILMVLVLATFSIWHRVEISAERQEGASRDDAGEGAAGGRAGTSPHVWLAALGVACGALFLAEYSAGALVLVAMGYAAWRFRRRGRWTALGLIAGGFLLVSGPWIVRNVALTGSPVALAVQNVALRAGDPTAEPATQRNLLSAELPAISLNKLGNKSLTRLQENVKAGVWSGGALWFAAFFVAGWLYPFRVRAVNRLRWFFTAGCGVLLVTQAALNSGESDRLVAGWTAPVMIVFGAGFFFVLLGSNAQLNRWPRLCAGVLLVAQSLPLIHDAMEPRRLHFQYPPYFPTLFMGLRQELERRGAMGQFGVMADVPAGAAWYGRQRVWSQPVNLRDFYTITLEQPIGELVLTPRTLDRPFFSELVGRPMAPGPLDRVTGFGEWGRIYSGLFTGRLPPEFPLGAPQRVAENLFVLLNPALPPPRQK
jgi:hypothetical protein